MLYVPLHTHSYYSLGSGTASLERILDTADRFQLKALALTDRSNLYGAIRFYQQARSRGIRPIIGAQVPVNDGQVILLARNQAGYTNLCQLITQLHLGPGAGGRAGISPLDRISGFDRSGAPHDQIHSLTTEQVEAHQEGLIALTDSPQILNALITRLARANLAAEVIRPTGNLNRERALLEVATKHRVRVAGTTGATLLNPNDIRFHRVLVAIRENALVTQLDPSLLCLPGHFLCDPGEFQRRFEDIPEAIRGTLEIAEECHLELSLGRPIFPPVSLSNGETATSRLRRMARKGLRERSTLNPDRIQRLDHELNVIQRLGFAEYFLVVADILRFARSQGIPSVGRGSGASSLVSYALRITNVDPIQYNIHFERFLNLSRSDCPDIDIDFCWHRRDEVIDYVFRRYGADHTAMICTHNTFRSRGAFREAAKACGLSNENVGRLAGRIDLENSIEENLSVIPAGMDLSDDHLRRILLQSKRLLGFPHHLSVHCGGVVISPDRIDTHSPLQRAAKGVIITQFEMNAIEDLGLVKIDLLGNRALSTIAEAIKLVKKERNISLQPEDIPEDDEKTFELIRKGLTVGCNQLESPAMRNLLQMCVPNKISDIIAALALVRPGASGGGMKEEYVRRLRGISPVIFPHPAVIDILKDSLGIMLYEDDAMLVGNRMLGLSMDEGDRFRKSIQKAITNEARDRIGLWFLNRCRQKSVSPQAAKSMWAQMVKFGAYSFCKSHACGYGQVAYQCAWLKAHFPAEFMTAVLNHHAGMYAGRSTLKRPNA